MRVLQRSVFAALLLPAVALTQSETRSQGDTLDLAVATFYENRIAHSIPLFSAAVRQSPGDPRRRAWLAEAYRRTEQLDSAVLEARRALLLEPCHAFAHEVLASVYNPQYTHWEGTNFDSTWVHLERAIGCSPGDPHAWLTWWVESFQRGDTLNENRALRELVHLQFLTRPWLAHARWVLETAPEHSILLVAGDVDTYPPVAVQSTEAIRTDVVIVNTSLLNLPAYVRRLETHDELPLPPSAELDTTTYLSDRILRYWRQLAAQGRFERPLLLANSAGATGVPDGPGVLKLAGPFWLLSADSTTEAYDSKAVRDALKRPRSMTGMAPVSRPSIEVLFVGLLRFTPLPWSRICWRCT
jgi:hypothetical protein